MAAIFCRDLWNIYLCVISNLVYKSMVLWAAALNLMLVLENMITVQKFEFCDLKNLQRFNIIIIQLKIT